MAVDIYLHKHSGCTGIDHHTSTARLEPANFSLEDKSVFSGTLLDNTTVDTSCDTPISQGSAFGNLVVISATLLNGAPLCCPTAITRNNTSGNYRMSFQPQCRITKQCM
jgi:hypothetical protein